MRRINGQKHIIIDGKKQFAVKTEVTPEWFNDVQEELCNLVESVNPLEEKRTQVTEAVDKKIKSAVDSILEMIKQYRAPIGSIIQTFLTEAQFLSQGYVGWVLCDGRNVDCSEYQKLGLGDIIPDCRGMFLQTYDPTATGIAGSEPHGIGEIDADATSANGIYLDGTTQGTIDNRPNGSGKLLRFVDADSLEVREIGIPKQTTDEKINVVVSKSATISGVDHYHTLQKDIIKSVYFDTKPMHVLVNTFIRIN